MEENVTAKNFGKEEAKKELFQRIVPGIVLGLGIALYLQINDMKQIPESRMGIGFSLFIGYICFCIPWCIGIIAKQFSHKANEQANRKYNEKKNGLDASDFLSSAKSVFVIMTVVLTMFFKVPYQIAKTVIVLNKK